MELVKFERARQALIEAKTIDEVKDVRDKAEALRLYVKQQKGSLEMQNHCAEIKLRAERKAGELIKNIPKKKNQKDSATSTLQEAGINHTQSARWQKEANVPDEQFEQFLTEKKESNEEITQSALLQTIRIKDREKEREQTRNNVSKTAAPTGKYRTIVIDPPWNPEDSGVANPIGKGEPNYSLMNLEQIEALPLDELSIEDDCHLYLWVTNRTMEKAFPLLEAWGFRFVTILTWCKTGIGVGRYFRNNTEHVIFAVKGSRLLGRADMGTWFETKRQGQHSTKPQEFFDMVEECSASPMLEMFARKKREGWTVWGGDV